MFYEKRIEPLDLKKRTIKSDFKFNSKIKNRYKIKKNLKYKKSKLFKYITKPISIFFF